MPHENGMEQLLSIFWALHPFSSLFTVCSLDLSQRSYLPILHKPSEFQPSHLPDGAECSPAPWPMHMTCSLDARSGAHVHTQICYTCPWLHRMTPQWTRAPKAAEFSLPNILAKCDFLFLLTFAILMGIKYCDGYIIS